jgi:hypothetical protein
MRNPKLSRRGSMARRPSAPERTDLFKTTERALESGSFSRFPARLKPEQFLLDNGQNLGLAAFPPSSKD